MARLIALLLVFCTAGVIVADAQCGVACTATQCNAPSNGTSCHHHQRPSQQQCLHQHSLTQTWMRTASWTAIQLQATSLAASAFLVPVPDRTSHVPIFNIAGEQPPGLLPATALRI
ncbi:MAG TPA: hypothetical protein VK335_15330 [Bryobacteraceae bacterium]|nr:hypothetical protein [Bryobacteraceae bacterium]